MKYEKNILIAFVLNLLFSIFEFIGGFLTNSVAIISDAVHDGCDAISIGISYFLERKSKKEPDQVYTFGYMRYSVLGAFITTGILLIGSIFVIYNAVLRIMNPVSINYNGMIIFAVFGVVVNLIAAYVTREKDSVNQRAVNLHMLEDVLGWVVVLIGSIIIKFTNINVLDSVMSILVSLFILFNACKNMKSIVFLFLDRVPSEISLDDLLDHLNSIDGVNSVHHVHIWSLDGINNYATLHLVSNSDDLLNIKKRVREELEGHGINHATIEIDNTKEECLDYKCTMKKEKKVHNHNH